MSTVIETFNRDPRNKIKAAINKTVDKVKDTTAKVWNWAVENKEVAIPIAIGALGIIADGAKQHNRDMRDKHENDRKLRTFWDPRECRHYYTNRVPSKRQSRVIGERYRNGESYGSILESMGLLD
jgi:hypothetical protein